MNRAFRVAGIVCVAAPASFGQFASRVVSYDPGSNPAPGFTDPSVALGEPTRFTGVASGFPGAVTPFNPPFEATEIVSIGEGGELVLELSRPARNGPANPFGIDLLVFSNNGYIDTNWPSGIAGGLFAPPRGVVSVSDDGQRWFEVPGVPAGGGFPTLGYLDLSGPYATGAGSVPSDFLRAVDPSFEASGKTFAEIVAAYDGSGGGAGVDLGVVGLGEARFVRITNPVGSGGPVQIDAVSVVPGPGGLALAVYGGVIVWARRRRGGEVVR